MTDSTIGLQPICLSGGAEGADAQWGMCAGMAGHQVIHFSFERHRLHVPASEAVVLKHEQLILADPVLAVANRTLQRTFPTSSYFVNSLLRRNWYQVRHAERVYAVSHIDKDGLVAGGTSWAVQMFLDRFESAPCECYVFDQDKGHWLVWNGQWEIVEFVPEPFGVWAGIGSRKLKPLGKTAIRGLLNYTPQPISEVILDA